MPRFRLLYDLVHTPTSSGTLQERYAAMLEQCEFADRGGVEAARIHEHHGSEENYVSSPLTVATAIAARTRSMRVRSLILTPFYDPVKLAEDVATMDVLSGGRTELLLVAGYRPAEFAMFQRRLADRRTTVDSTAAFLRKAWTGDSFDFRGRKGRIRPLPVQRPHPRLVLGGGSRAAARAAARYADDFEPNARHLWDLYRAELLQLGKPDPGALAPHGPHFLHISEDPERDWVQIRGCILGMLRMYSAWARTAPEAMSHRFSDVPEKLELDGDPNYCIVTPDECVERLEPLGPEGLVSVNPMWGGVEPDLAWSSVELLVSKVLPRLTRGADPHPHWTS